MEDKRQNTACQEAPAGVRFIKSREAAAFLGVKMSYLYKLIHEKRIPYYKYGGRLVLFSEQELQAWREARLHHVPSWSQHEEAAY